MLRKFIISVICCMSILSVSLVCSYADTVITSDDHMQCFDNSSASSILSSYFDKSVRLSFESLSDLCVQVNNDILSGVFGNSVKNYSATIASFTVGGSSYYGIALKYGSNTLWYCRYPYGLYYARIDTDTFIGYISDKLTTVVSNLGTISATVSTISGTLTDKLTSMESSLTRLLSRTLKTDQDGVQYTLAELMYNTWRQTERAASRLLKPVDNVQYTVADLQYNTWRQMERASGRLLKTVDNVPYTVADLQYNTWQQAENAVAKLGSIDTRLSTLHTDAIGIAGKLDNIADLLSATTYTCGYKSNASGVAYPTQTIPYDMAVQIVARINSAMLGKQMTVIKQDGSGTMPVTISRCMIDGSGYIFVRSASSVFYLCGKDNTIFVAAQDYTKSIYSRLTDVISAVNNLTVGVDLSDVQLSVDASSINLFNNSAYCCGYLTDADGNKYPVLPIPYDAATAIVERLNTDYIDKKITVLQRSGTTFTGSVKHAYISASGNINLRLTNGYGYALCDSANTIFQVDASTNYGNRTNDTLTNISSRLDSTQASVDSSLSIIISKMGNLSGSSSDLSTIESALSTIIDKMDNLPASVDNIVVNITKDNDAYNVFYVEDENGDKKSVTSVAGDSLSASGKLLQFLYKLIIGSAISDVDSSINGLNDFYFDNAPSGLGEGVTVWD